LPGTGFVISAWVYYLLTPDGYPLRKLLLVGIVTIWGLRLSVALGVAIGISLGFDFACPPLVHCRSCGFKLDGR